MSDGTTTPGDCPIETATEEGWFGITTAEDFFRKVCTDYERALKDIADPYAAMNCILSLYHLHEWVWWCWLKGRDDVLSALDIRDNEEDFRRLLEKHCPHFDLLRELANGTKHFRIKKRQRIDHTQRGAGYGNGPYGIGPWGTSYLLVDLGEDEEPATRYLTVSKVLKGILEYWRSFFTEHRVFDPPEEDNER